MRRADATAHDLALWGGIECSHVRIGETERDQCLESGHKDRPGDLELIAGLGLKTLRYPLLWAHVEGADGRQDFSWHEERFARLRDLGVTPIAGFLHHGSGPGGLDPLHPDFVPRFADFAEAVAERFDWIDDFTPINEPVTTARFAYLYGHWHPHTTEEPLFLRAVVAKIRAVSEAMRRIRRRNPRARLIQTEDVGRIFSVPSLAYQADYENERRFLGFDLLTGRVDRGHPLWRRLLASGVSARDLDALADAPCPPDVIGVDHYLTSDRFLDDDPSRHPGAPVGGNGRARYVDVAAVHLPELREEVGILPRLRDVHARYGLPMAVTEVHNGCTREEQLRWLLDAWRDGRAARAEGLPLLAITSWALMGTWDWNSLMIKRAGFYESGAFDTRCDPPRMTAVGKAVEALARTGDYGHPLLELGGWWRDCDGSRVSGLPHFNVVGEAAEVAEFVGCCRVRRIPVVEGPRRAAAVSGEIRIDPPSRSGWRRLRHRRRDDPNAHSLIVEARTDADFCCVANAFLDLVIDGETGRFRLEDVGPYNQYRVVGLVTDADIALPPPAARRW